jgi:hypothetical protein
MSSQQEHKAFEPTEELIEQVIESQQLNDLLYVKEASWFEFREKPYLTTSPNPAGAKAKFELAKDCSAIANSGGGYIFIGLRPETIGSEMTEFVAEIKGFKKSAINLTSWRDSLVRSLVPRFSLEDISHGFLDLREEETVMWMKIPDAKEIGVFPLLYHHDQVQEGEHKLSGQVIGVYERYGAENNLLSSDKLQGYLAQGLANEKTGQPFGQDIKRIETTLQRLLDRQQAEPVGRSASERVTKFLVDARSKLGEDDEPFFYIFSSPDQRTSIPKFWSPYSNEESMPRLLKHPPVLRRMGWDLMVADQEFPSAEPGAWQIMNGNRKLFQVSEKGELFAGVTIRMFLDWGMDTVRRQTQQYDVLLNEYAFAEFIAMYFQFLNKLSERLEAAQEGTEYNAVFGFENVGDQKIGLHEPLMVGIPSNGTAGPLREPFHWEVEYLDPHDPYTNAGFVMQAITRSGFGVVEDSQYFLREDGVLRFDPSSYTSQ